MAEASGFRVQGLDLPVLPKIKDPQTPSIELALVVSGEGH